MKVQRPFKGFVAERSEVQTLHTERFKEFSQQAFQKFVCNVMFVILLLIVKSKLQ